MNIGTILALATLALALFLQTAALAFYLGGLSQRVTSNSTAIEKLQGGESTDGERNNGILARLVTLETELRHLTTQSEQLQRVNEGLARQVASLVTMRRPGTAPPLMDAFGEG